MDRSHDARIELVRASFGFMGRHLAHFIGAGQKMLHFVNLHAHPEM
jgi:hypothetical protein